MHDILGDLPAARRIPAAKAESMRMGIERAVRARPRRRTRRGWLLVPAGAVALLVAVLLVADVLVTPQPAYASWTAEPSGLGPAETAALGTRCADDVRDAFPDAASDLRPVVGERRGVFQTALVASGRQVALCADWLGVRDGDSVRGGTLSGLTPDAALAPGEVLQTVAVPGQASGPDAARIAYGLVSPEVSRVTVDTADGRHVTASVHDGYFLAWWPSGADPEQVTAFDSAGRALVPPVR
ncbi:hypothetical protein GCM10022243_25570 [Saccharothrix violaceirubra]|uniref:Uncharacterized protein n=1 Tax=Saccharothrix violaceirubra TaxID=413306 RepID=A0A7W7T3S8_9PSEU|nr:hypothetical protein [Saccharothrix violaceirubra]MBB4966044.1 hypothetical protein [Saccharothrix violaceirubra]